MNVSGFPALARLRCQTTQQSEVVIVNTQPVVDILIGNNTLNSAEVDFDLIQCDGNGLLNGTFDSVGQTPLAPPSPVGQAAITSLVGKGWTVTTDPWQFVFADGGGGFWDLVVDPLGNVGTTAGVAPATADVILDDGVGGFWKVAVDVTGLRYTIADPGPATAAPVLFDGEGGFWQLVVNALGNLGATLVYHYPVYWEPYTEIITWTDTNGVQTGNLVDFTATVDLATLTNVTANGLAITDLIFDGTQLPALTMIDCQNNASLTNFDVSDCSSLVTLNCLFCDITGTLDLTNLSNLVNLDCNTNINLTAITLTGCTSLQNIIADVCGITGSFDVSAVSSLVTLSASQCPNLTGLILTGLSSLTSLNALTSDLTGALDLTPCTSLDLVNVDQNSNLTSVDVTGLTVLTTFSSDMCDLTGTMDLSTCSIIAFVDVSNNANLTGLTINSNIFNHDVLAQNCALTTAQVDDVLNKLVAGGGAGGQALLDGGTNGAPTLSCANPLSDCWTLINVTGWTVTTN